MRRSASTQATSACSCTSSIASRPLLASKTVYCALKTRPSAFRLVLIVIDAENDRFARLLRDL